MRTLIVVILLLCLSLSCEKDNIKSIYDIEVQLDLLDENYNLSRNFSYGEDLVFKYTETNKTSDTIYYYGTHCPIFHFRVYDESSNLIGDPIPSNWGCTDILKLLNIAPNETIVSEINWFNDTTNAPLPIGSYKLKFENTIVIPEINESKKYNLIMDFKIE
jgi:hypothetical protein